MKTTHPFLKTSLTSIFIYCLVACAPLAAISQNLVTNSAFSLGSTGWATACSMEVNPELAYGGTSATNLATEIDVERCFNQDVCILPGISYTFSFKASRRTQSQTVAAPGIIFTVTGTTTATKYINVTKTYTNTTFNLQTETYTFSIPANTTDRKVNIAFSNYNNTGTYGVILDDIQLAPVAASTLSVNGADIVSPGQVSNWSVNNTTASVASYTWNFGATANPSVSTLAAPTAVQWSAIGTSNVTVALSNGTCTVTTVSKTVYIINQLLPVRFISFTGAAQQGSNKLYWSTEQEENNKYFVMERSANGVAFDSIGVLPAVVNGSVNNYSFTDARFNAGNQYYRLRQVNKDGSHTLSAVVIINNNTSLKATVQVYPNPAVATIHFALNTNTTAMAAVQILNASGAVLINKKQSVLAGNNQYAVDISSLGAGMYFIRVTNENGSIQIAQPFSKMP